MSMSVANVLWKRRLKKALAGFLRSCLLIKKSGFHEGILKTSQMLVQQGHQAEEEEDLKKQPMHETFAKDAVDDLESLLSEAKKDEETRYLVSRLKTDMAHELDDLRKLSPEEVTAGMEEAVQSMKQLDLLFKDEKRALKQFEKEGMIAKKHLKRYKKNPGLLKEDTRKGLYFQFVSLGVIGGYFS